MNESPRMQSEDVFPKVKFGCLSFLNHQNPTGTHLIHKSPGSQLILYKFIVWVFLGLNLYLCYAIMTLQLVPSMGNLVF